MMQDQVFRKYDIRGEVNKDFTVEDTYYVAKAIASFFKQKNSIKSVAIGMDGRVHSAAIKEQITKALLESGFDVTFLGLCHTPAVYFATHTINVQAGIMITASHNPKEDNGLKIIVNQEAIWADEIQEIKNLYKSKAQLTGVKGKYTEYFIINDYVNYLVNLFPNLKNLEINCVIDCGNGAAGSVLPFLIKKMNWKNATTLFEEVDGNYPNHEPDPTKEKNMSDVKKYLSDNPKYEFAIGLDGDCDRMALMSKAGYLLPGDQLLGIFSQFISSDNKKSVVFDISCSMGLVNLLEKTDMNAHMTPTGNSYIKDMMKKTGALLGGELSGHFCFADRYFGFDDGIYALMRIIEIIKTHNKSVDELLNLLPKQISSPSIRMLCPEEKKYTVINNAKQIFAKRTDIQIIDIDGVRIHTKYGCGLLRASNTQPMLSLRFESNDVEGLAKIKNDFYETMAPYFENEWLKNQLEL